MLLLLLLLDPLDDLARRSAAASRIMEACSVLSSSTPFRLYTSSHSEIKILDMASASSASLNSTACTRKDLVRLASLFRVQQTKMTYFSTCPTDRIWWKGCDSEKRPDWVAICNILGHRLPTMPVACPGTVITVTSNRAALADCSFN